jgi:hypothetical protein
MGCGHHASSVLAVLARAARYAKVEKLLVKRSSQRSIVCMAGVSCVMVTKLAKNRRRQASPCLACDRLRPDSENERRWNSMKYERS